jgi:hypothetical protein
MRELVRVTKPGGLITISVNEKHWNALDFESEVKKLGKSTRGYALKKLSIYGDQSTHNNKDDKAIILSIDM